MIRKKNIILFSSGVTEQHGILKGLKEQLEKRGYKCSYWRDLFQGANDRDHIALLPILIKKIPTFDFAILICEGHDETKILRNGNWYTEHTMRDNVLFEIGLCTMALGLNRTILVTNRTVRLPDDLMGLHHEVALKQIVYASKKVSDCKTVMGEVPHDISEMEKAAILADAYIRENEDKLSPAVVGASSSIASGYVSNFILRMLEHIEEGVYLQGRENKVIFSQEKIFVHIFLPEVYTDDFPELVKCILEKYAKGTVIKARIRSVEFYYEIRNGELHIVDYPTTIITSYDTASMILNIDGDDADDSDAQARFVAKELDLFEMALRKLLTPQFVATTVDNYYVDMGQEERDGMVERICCMLEKQIIITRVPYEKLVEKSKKTIAIMGY